MGERRKESRDILVGETLYFSGSPVPLVSLVDLFCAVFAESDMFLAAKQGRVIRGRRGCARVGRRRLETRLDAREGGSAEVKVVA